MYVLASWTFRHVDVTAQGYFGLGDVSARGRFGTVDVSAHGRFGSVDVSARGHFGTVDASACGHFGTVDISAQGFFGTGHFSMDFLGTFQVGNFLAWTIWHKNISAGYFLASWTFQHGDVTAVGHFGNTGATETTFPPRRFMYLISQFNSKSFWLHLVFLRGAIS